MILVAILIYLAIGLVLSFLAILIHKIQKKRGIYTGDGDASQIGPGITFFWAFILIFLLASGIVWVLTKGFELYTDFVDKLINKKK